MRPCCSQKYALALLSGGDRWLERRKNCLAQHRAGPREGRGTKRDVSRRPAHSTCAQGTRNRRRVKQYMAVCRGGQQKKREEPTSSKTSFSPFWVSAEHSTYFTARKFFARASASSTEIGFCVPLSSCHRRNKGRSTTERDRTALTNRRRPC